MRDTSQEFLLSAEKVKKKEEVSSLRGIVNLSSLAFYHISNSSPSFHTAAPCGRTCPVRRKVRKVTAFVAALTLSALGLITGVSNFLIIRVLRARAVIPVAYLLEKSEL